MATDSKYWDEFLERRSKGEGAIAAAIDNHMDKVQEWLKKPGSHAKELGTDFAEKFKAYEAAVKKLSQTLKPTGITYSNAAPGPTDYPGIAQWNQPGALKKRFKGKIDDADKAKLARQIPEDQMDLGKKRDAIIGDLARALVRDDKKGLLEKALGRGTGHIIAGRVARELLERHARKLVGEPATCAPKQKMDHLPPVQHPNGMAGQELRMPGLIDAPPAFHGESERFLESKGKAPLANNKKKHRETAIIKAADGDEPVKFIPLKSEKVITYSHAPTAGSGSGRNAPPVTTAKGTRGKHPPRQHIVRPIPTGPYS